MAKNSIRDYSATASQNTDIDSIDIDENCPASNLNNSQRALMAHLKNVSTGAVNLETPAADRLDVDNLRLDGNTISSTDTNGDITLDPNGTGDTIIASGNVGIGTVTPATSLDVVRNGVQPIRVQSTSGTEVAINMVNTGGNVQLEAHSGNFTIDADNVGIGTTSPSQVLHLSNASTSYALAETTGTGTSAGFRVKGGASADYTLFTTQGTNQFAIYDNAANSERLRIHSNGALTLKTTQTNPYDTNQAGLAYGHAGDYVLRNTGTGSLSALFNQQTEGSLLLFAHAGTTEGSVSISGTTVTFGGGHLARWSRLPDNTKDTAIVKGTVMTNLNQMVVWHHDAQAATYYEEGDELPDGVSVGDEKTAAVGAYDEDNEQLNCTAVSDTEGDGDVAGVFVKWDDGDDYNDFYLAMTGDMVIRIASGTTVARGDLLMSAGDGTAKPQGDDIVRSKTIAKVTSTTVSHTYDDGTYLVPCVLMAC